MVRYFLKGLLTSEALFKFHIRHLASLPRSMSAFSSASASDHLAKVTANSSSPVPPTNASTRKCGLILWSTPVKTVASAPCYKVTIHRFEAIDFQHSKSKHLTAQSGIFQTVLRVSAKTTPRLSRSERIKKSKRAHSHLFHHNQ